MALKMRKISKKWIQQDLVPCSCCDATTSEGSEQCCRCRMPLSISSSALSRRVLPHFIPILGASGVGKSTYTGMLLEMLRKGSDGVTASFKSSSTIAIQRETMTALSQRQFPTHTSEDCSEWKWVHSELDAKPLESGFEWVTPDISGDSFESELSESKSTPAIPAMVKKASAVIVLLDAMRAVDPNFPNENHVATKIASFIHKNAVNDDETGSVNIPVAFAFTKTDLCKIAADDPEDFAKRNLPGFFEYVQRRLPNHRFFAVSVAGSVAKLKGGLHLPMHLQPRGVVAPLTWTLTS